MGEMLKGILEFCVMTLISKKESYGYDITRSLNNIGFTGTVEGTVYAILVRLEKNGYVSVAKRPSELGPERKFYKLNQEGKRQLAERWSDWDGLCRSVNGLREGYLNDKNI